jgi:hypothetical protein
LSIACMSGAKTNAERPNLAGPIRTSAAQLAGTLNLRR